MKDISFEKAFETLEKTVEELESGGFTLDTALKKYEEGIKMARICQAKLEKAKERIEILVKEKNGKFTTSKLDEE
ncbi:MAG TPA: exodeoxyribonuclease VII small subunit [Candidatus Omnitrophota bacterium]|nr:exodeoxyribonuclease VII small subunit [Candidatus Omnitrophota bacterium]